MKTAIWTALLLTAPASAEAADLAIVGGDVYPVSSSMIPDATVLIESDRITAVGKDVPVPKGAKVIDAKGKIVTPGLIESDTLLGLVEISLVEQTVDAVPEREDPVRAALRAEDGIDLRSTLWGVARRHGVTSAVTGPTGGLVSGSAAWVDLLDPSSPGAHDRAVRPSVAMSVSLGETGASAVGGSRVTAVARLREALDDARAYKRGRAAFNRRALHELSISRLDAEALVKVIDRKLPVLVEVARASDILRVLDLAKEERIRVALIGAEEGWMVADQIAKAEVPVIVDPFENLPHSFEGRHARADNAALLAGAGVDLAIAVRSSHNASKLRFALGNAVRAGLPRDVALKAATLTPAEIFGQGKRYGAIARGRVANVVVWTGDPFQPSSYAETVVVQGAIQPTDNRQTALARRHARRLGLTGEAR